MRPLGHLSHDHVPMTRFMTMKYGKARFEIAFVFPFFNGSYEDRAASGKLFHHIDGSIILPIKQHTRHFERMESNSVIAETWKRSSGAAGAIPGTSTWRLSAHHCGMSRRTPGEGTSRHTSFQRHPPADDFHDACNSRGRNLQGHGALSPTRKEHEPTGTNACSHDRHRHGHPGRRISS